MVGIYIQHTRSDGLSVPATESAKVAACGNGCQQFPSKVGQLGGTPVTTEPLFYASQPASSRCRLDTPNTLDPPRGGIEFKVLLKQLEEINEAYLQGLCSDGTMVLIPARS